MTRQRRFQNRENDPKPQLADVVGHFSNSEGAGASVRGSVGAWVARVPDVGGVGGDGGAAGGGGDDAADPEARGTGAGGRPSPAAALGGGVAGAVGGGGAPAGALLVRELDDAEQRELLFMEKDTISSTIHIFYFLLFSLSWVWLMSMERHTIQAIQSILIFTILLPD